MIQLAVHGADGRMGRRLIALSSSDDRFQLAAALRRDRGPAPPGRGAAPAVGPVDVIVDFSSDAGARNAAEIAGATGAALLVGTTGLSRQTLDVLDDLARSTPVMIAPNTSRGIAVLNDLLGRAASLLGPGYEVDLIEQHHRWKRDAPSGTALRLARGLRQRAGIDLPAERIHSVRAGEVVGEHEVRFTGPGERLVLSHEVMSRDVFAAGALDAAAWLIEQPPGRYGIEQALGLGDRGDRLDAGAQPPVE